MGRVVATPRRGRGLTPSRLVYLALFGLFLLYLIGPLIATVLFSFGAPQYTFEHYARAGGDNPSPLLNRSDLLGSLQHSLFVALCATVFAVVICLPTAYWVQVRARWAARLLEVLTLLPFATQGVILVIGLQKVYGHRPLLLTFTPYILILSYTMIGVPFMYRAIGNGFASFDVKNLEWAARTLGAGFWSTLRLVMIPNVTPSLVNGAILVFATSMAEYPLAKYLVGSDFTTFPVYITAVGGNDPRDGAVLSLAGFAITLVCSLVVIWAARRGRSGVVSGTVVT